MSLPAAGTQEKPAIKPCQNFEGHTKWVNGVVHLPGGQQIMTSSWDGSLRVWNLRSGKQIAHDWQDEKDPMNTIALSPDGKKVVGGSMNGVVRLWNINIDTGKAAEWTGHTKYITSVCWNRDSGRVVSGSEDGTARVWDVENGKTVLAIETGFREVAAVSYSPDTSMIAIDGENKEKEVLKIWDANTGKIVSNIIAGHTKKVKCLAWTADGRTLISGASDKSIRMWNTSTWQQIKVLTWHASSVEAIAISPNGHILASASRDYTARLWNLENGQPIGSPLQHTNSVDSVSFSTDGKLLAIGCWDCNAYSWDVSMIIREAGLDELLQNPNSILKADAPRGLARNQRPENAHRLPAGFFGDSLPHPQPELSRTPRLSRSSARDDRLSRPRFLEWARNYFFNSPHSQNGIELQNHRPVVVNAPFAQGHFRNYSAREARIKKEKEESRRKKEKEEAKNAKNASSGGSSPPQNSVTQSPGGAEVQPSSELHAVAVAPATTTHWVRFWSAACCIPGQNTDDHH